jgi:hypothetical protein
MGLLLIIIVGEPGAATVRTLDAQDIVLAVAPVRAVVVATPDAITITGEAAVVVAGIRHWAPP